MRHTLLLVALIFPLALGAQTAEKLQQKAERGDTKAMVELARWYESGHLLPADSARSLALIRQAADAGDADALGHLARYTLHYSALGHDTATALRLAQQSHAKGSAYGTFRLAIHTYSGFGLPADKAEGRRLLEQAADRKDAAAIDELADCHMTGSWGYSQDVHRGAKLFLKEPDVPGNYDKAFRLYEYYTNEGRPAEARRWLERGLALDQMPALIEHATSLGSDDSTLAALQALLAKHPGNEQLTYTLAGLRAFSFSPAIHDTAEAVRLYLQGHEYDMLGDNYYHGNFTAHDTLRAYRYWRLGAAEGQPYCMAQMANVYWRAGQTDSLFLLARRALAKNGASAANVLARYYYTAGQVDSALYYFNLSADHGSPEDRVTAADIELERGNTEAAIALLNQAVDKGCYYDALTDLANIQMNQGNEKKAIKTLERGAKLHNAQCCIVLARYYLANGDPAKAEQTLAQAQSLETDTELGRLYLTGELGDGEEADLRHGFELSRRVALRHHALTPAFNTAVAFENGRGTAQDYDSARHYYTLLAEHNYAEAIRALGVMAEQGEGCVPDTLEAIRLYERAGAEGDGPSWFFIAEHLLTGHDGQAPDSARAFTYLMRAADLGEGPALDAVALCHLSGFPGVARDTAAALPYFRRAHEADGSPIAAAYLGDYYNYGWAGVRQDGDSALFFYKEASDADHPHGDYMIGQYLYEQGLYPQALSYLQSAAGNGNIDAYVTIAHAVLMGNGAEQDPENAVNTLAELAEHDGSGRAYAILGLAYASGLLGSEDYDHAVEYISKGAELGNSQCMLLLAKIYALEDNPGRDTVASLRWSERAAATGSIEAILSLADRLHDGEACPKDLRRAAELYQQAADRGSTKAMCQLANCYEEGEGVILNSRRAYNLYLEAAERGAPYAMRMVAYCYDEGVYVEHDDSQVTAWLIRAADAGDVVSCYLVGMRYATGEGVKKDKKQARAYLTQAAEAGYEPAAKALGDL